MSDRGITWVGGKSTQVAGGSYLIDPSGHKAAQKTQKIYNKATDKKAGGSEKDWLKKTGPQKFPGV